MSKKGFRNPQVEIGLRQPGFLVTISNAHTLAPCSQMVSAEQDLESDMIDVDR